MKARVYKTYDEPQSTNVFSCFKNMTESPLQVVTPQEIRAKQDLANCNSPIA